MRTRYFYLDISFIFTISNPSSTKPPLKVEKQKVVKGLNTHYICQKRRISLAEKTQFFNTFLWTREVI